MKKKDLIKGNLQSIVFKILEEQGESYAYEIIKIAKNKTEGGIEITEGAIYPILHKLEEDGVLEAYIKNIGNRKRKYYKLTNQGEKIAQNQLKQAIEFLNNLNLILNPPPIEKKKS
jgi:DNA-binding PadR family transcriptional regulator